MGERAATYASSVKRRTSGILVSVLASLLVSGASAGASAGSDERVGEAAVTQPVAGTLDSTSSLRRTANNPLAGRAWGSAYGWKSPYDDPMSAEDEALVQAKIWSRPMAPWMGSWIPDDQIEQRVARYIATAQDGDREALTQLATFRMVPWEGDACERLSTEAEQASYRTWVDNFAAGIGDAHVAVIVQPDGPFSMCAPGGSRLHSRMVAYQARTLAAQPNTSVYVEVGSADWPYNDPEGAARIAMRSGVRHARGIALNGTHYDTTERQVLHGAAVVQVLARRGITGKKVVINTAQNGRGFPGVEYRATYGLDRDCDLELGDESCFDNAPVCTDQVRKVCATLGIPPTTDVADPAWGLSDRANRKARRFVDAYLWFGRPWLFQQAWPYQPDRAAQLARSTPW